MLYHAHLSISSKWNQLGIVIAIHTAAHVLCSLPTP